MRPIGTRTKDLPQYSQPGRERLAGAAMTDGPRGAQWQVPVKLSLRLKPCEETGVTESALTVWIRCARISILEDFYHMSKNIRAIHLEAVPISEDRIPQMVLLQRERFPRRDRDRLGAERIRLVETECVVFDLGDGALDGHVSRHPQGELFH